MAKNDDHGVGKRALAIYNELPELRALIAIIPVVGGAIDVLLSSRWSQMSEQRVKRLIEDLSEATTLIDGDKVDRAFLESEAFADLVIRAFSAATRTRERDQIRLYAGILAGAIRLDGPPDFDSEGALSSIAELSPIEVRLARAIYEEQVERSAGGAQGWGNPYGWLGREFHADLDFHLKRIERTGLIQGLVSGAPVGRPISYYDVTPTFRRLMDVLKTPVLEAK